MSVQKYKRHKVCLTDLVKLWHALRCGPTLYFGQHASPLDIHMTYLEGRLVGRNGSKVVVPR